MCTQQEVRNSGYFHAWGPYREGEMHPSPSPSTCREASLLGNFQYGLLKAYINISVSFLISLTGKVLFVWLFIVCLVLFYWSCFVFHLHFIYPFYRNTCLLSFCDSWMLPRKLLELENTLERWTDSSLMTSALFVLKSTCPHTHTLRLYWPIVTELGLLNLQYQTGSRPRGVLGGVFYEDICLS